MIVALLVVWVAMILWVVLKVVYRWGLSRGYRNGYADAIRLAKEVMLNYWKLK